MISCRCFGADEPVPQPVAEHEDVHMRADRDARAFAEDPEHNVVLEASAGTGKTSVLVSRYVNLLLRGVDPANILAITFTRKAAAEMRERIIRDLRRAADQSTLDRSRGSTCATVSATSRSARSTRSACRCCASFRSKRISIRASRWPTKRRCRALVDQSLDKSLRDLHRSRQERARTSRWSSHSWDCPGPAKGSRIF